MIAQSVFCALTGFQRKDFPKSSIFRGFKLFIGAAFALLAALAMVSCDPPAESSSKPAKRPGIKKGIEKKTGNPNVTEIEGADLFGGANTNYYTVDTTQVVQIEPSHIGSSITGDVTYTVTQVGESGQVGYIADISGQR